MACSLNICFKCPLCYFKIMDQICSLMLTGNFKEAVSWNLRKTDPVGIHSVFKKNTFLNFLLSSSLHAKRNESSRNREYSKERLLTNTMMFGKRNILEGQKTSVSFIYTRKYWVSESLCSWLWFNFCVTARFFHFYSYSYYYYHVDVLLLKHFAIIN